MIFNKKKPEHMRWIYMAIPVVLALFFVLPGGFWRAIPGVGLLFSPSSSSEESVFPWRSQEADDASGSQSPSPWAGDNGGPVGKDGIRIRFQGKGVAYGGEETDGLADGEIKGKPVRDTDKKPPTVDPYRSKSAPVKQSKMDKGGKKDSPGVAAGGASRPEAERLPPISGQTGERWAGGGAASGGPLGMGGRPGDRPGAMQAAGTTVRETGTLGKVGDRYARSKFGSDGSAQDPAAIGRRSALTGYSPGGNEGASGTKDGGLKPGEAGPGVGGANNPGTTGNLNEQREGPGIGGQITAPETGPGAPANDRPEIQGTDECPVVNAGCEQIYANYDAQIAALETQMQSCYTWVNMGKGGMVQVVDQACYDRVNANLQAVRAERNQAVKECQAEQGNCK